MAGFVYLIGNSIFKWYKIGKTKTPNVRIRNIGILLPFKVSIIGIWKAENHSALESLLHKKYGYCAINGEWFLFQQGEASKLFDILPEDSCVFSRHKKNEIKLSNFSNLKRDCPDGHVIRYKVKKMKGTFTEEERARLKMESMILHARKRIESGKPLTQAQQNILRAIGEID